MDLINVIDLIIEKKRFQSYKVISRGKFASTIEIDYKDKQKKTAALIMMKKEAEKKKFDFDEIKNPYIVQAIQHEYMCTFQSYLIYTETGDCSLQDKISDKYFRHSPKAIESIFNWIKQASMGLKKLHSRGFVHLNIRTTSILIFSENTAKLGCLDFARHSSTENERYETGSESFYRPPESFSRNSSAFDGEKFDTWCLAILTTEALTKNSIGIKSSKITTWPEQYAVIYKILQVQKFKKIVKNAYPKAEKVENMEKVVYLMKHTLKFYPEERPEISEYLILLLELSFLKDIDKPLTEDKIWKKKVDFNEMKYESQCMALRIKPPNTTKEVKSKYGQVLHDEMIIHDIVEDVELHHIPPRSQYNTKEKKFLTSGDGDVSQKFCENFTLKEQEISNSKRNEREYKNQMMGDIVQDEIEIRNKDNPFKHTDLHCTEASSSGIQSSKSENVQIVKPDLREKYYPKRDFRKITDEKRVLSKQNITCFQHSDIHLLETASNVTNLAEKNDGVITCENEKHLDENSSEQSTRCILTTKGIFRRVINWVLDANLYTGVMQSESYINKLSKAITG